MDDKKFDEAIKVLVMLRADVIEHGRKIDDRINEQQRALSEESERFRRQVGNIVDNAGKTIRQETVQSLDSASEGYRRAVDELNREVGKFNKIIKSWYIGIGVVLAIAAIILFVVVRYTVVDLADRREELESYEHAIETAKAFAESDAYICEGRICINAGKNVGNGYRQAKPRKK